MRIFTPIDTFRASIANKQSHASPATLWGMSLVLVILAVWAAGYIIGFISAVALLTLIGFAAAIVGLRYPTLGLLGMGILCALDPVTKLLLLSASGIFRWHTLNYYLLIVMVLHAPFMLRLSDLQTRMFQLFLILISVEVVASPSRLLGLDVILGIVTMLGLLFYFARVGSDRRAWYWLGIVTGVLAAAGGLLFYLQQDRLPPVDPNNWCFFALTALFAICLALPFAPNGYSQLTLAGLGLINFGWVFLSGSRGGLLQALMCMCALMLMLRGFFNRVALLMIAVMVGLVLSTLFPNLQVQAIERIDLLLNNTQSLRLRTSGRSELLIGGWYLFLHNPLGVGTGGFAPTWASIGIVEGLSGYASNYEKAAHAGWLKVLVENGIAGIVLLAGYVLSFAVSGWRNRSRNFVIIGLFTTATLGLSFTAVELQWGKAVWFLIAGVTALLHSEEIAAHLHEATWRKPITNIVRPTKTTYPQAD